MEYRKALFSFTVGFPFGCWLFLLSPVGLAEESFLPHATEGSGAGQKVLSKDHYREKIKGLSEKFASRVKCCFCVYQEPEPLPGKGAQACSGHKTQEACEARSAQGICVWEQAPGTDGMICRSQYVKDCEARGAFRTNPATSDCDRYFQFGSIGFKKKSALMETVIQSSVKDNACSESYIFYSGHGSGSVAASALQNLCTSCRGGKASAECTGCNNGLNSDADGNATRRERAKKWCNDYFDAGFTGEHTYRAQQTLVTSFTSLTPVTTSFEVTETRCKWKVTYDPCSSYSPACGGFPNTTNKNHVYACTESGKIVYKKCTCGAWCSWADIDPPKDQELEGIVYKVPGTSKAPETYRSENVLKPKFIESVQR